MTAQDAKVRVVWLETVRVYLVCPCGGKMLPAETLNGRPRPTKPRLSPGPPSLYRHRCGKCGSMQTVDGTYPRDETRERTDKDPFDGLYGTWCNS